MTDAIDAVSSGQRLSDWITTATIGKTAAYQLLKALGIEPAKTRFPGSAAAVSVLTAEQVAAMDAAAKAMTVHGRSIAEISSAITRPRTATDARDDQPAVDGHAVDPGPLMARMAAAEAAIRSGLPLTTGEVEWILGARPGTATVVRGRIIATRHGRNVWTLASVES